MKHFWKINLLGAFIVAASFALAVGHGFSQAEAAAAAPGQHLAAAR